MSYDLKNDPAVIDYAKFNAITADGDEREVLITMVYDLGDDTYVIEQEVDGQNTETEFYPNSDSASAALARMTKEATDFYDSERREYERGQVKLIVEALRELTYNDLDSETLKAIAMLANIIESGHATAARASLELMFKAIRQ